MPKETRQAKPWLDKFTDIARAVREVASKKDDPSGREAVTEAKESNRIAREELRQAKWNTRAQVAALVLSGVAVVLAFTAYLQTRDSVTLARQDLVAANRAWIELGKPRGTWNTAEPKDIDILAAEFNITNIGKSPAIELRIQSGVEVVEARKDPALQFDEPFIVTRIGVIFPGRTEDAPVLRRREKFKQPARPLSDDERARLAKGEAAILFYARAIYKDEYGEHFTQICVYRPFNQAFVPSFECTAFNAVGEAKDLPIVQSGGVRPGQ